MLAGERDNVASSTGTDTAEKFCAICDKPCRHQHYGKDTCEACAAFYRRALTSTYAVTCTCRKAVRSPAPEQRLSVSDSQRLTCKYCRLKKCVQVGMIVPTVRAFLDAECGLLRPGDSPLRSATIRRHATFVNRMQLLARTPSKDRSYAGVHRMMSILAGELTLLHDYLCNCPDFNELFSPNVSIVRIAADLLPVWSTFETGIATAAGISGRAQELRLVDGTRVELSEAALRSISHSVGSREEFAGLTLDKCLETMSFPRQLLRAKLDDAEVAALQLLVLAQHGSVFVRNKLALHKFQNKVLAQLGQHYAQRGCDAALRIATLTSLLAEFQSIRRICEEISVIADLCSPDMSHRVTDSTPSPEMSIMPNSDNELVELLNLRPVLRAFACF